MHAEPLEPLPRQVADLLGIPCQLGRFVLGYGPAEFRRWRAHREAGYPHPWVDPVGSAFGLTDTVLMSAAKVVLHDVDGVRRAAITEEVREALALHQRRGWDLAPERYHVTPEVPHPQTPARRGDWEILRYDSSYAPPADEPGAYRWQARAANRTAVLRVRRVAGDRPWVVLVHGAGMGSHTTDQLIFDAQHLGDRLRVNVVMPVLPLHGPRRTPGAQIDTTLPNPDLLDNLHGLSQAIHDVRGALAWVRAETDAPIALYGISLGGLAVASAAALEPALSAVIAGVPLVDASRVLFDKAPSRTRRAPWFEAVRGESDRLMRVVSPLALPRPATDSLRLNVYAGRSDRVLPPLQHAVPLAQHWGKTSIQWWRSSHTSHLLSSEQRRYVGRTLREQLVDQPITSQTWHVAHRGTNAAG